MLGPPVRWRLPLGGGEEGGRHHPELFAPAHEGFGHVTAVRGGRQLGLKAVSLLE